MHLAALLMVFLVVFSLPGDGARILAVFPFPAQSHVNVLSGLTKALAARGHELVVASPFKQKKPLPNYMEIDLMPALKEIKERTLGANLFEMRDKTFFELCFKFWGMGLATTEAVINSPQIKKIMEDSKGFDLVITEVFLNEALYGLAHHFKAPLVLVCPFGGFHWHNLGFANPTPTSYVPNPRLEFSDKMTFKERLINTLFTWSWELGHHLFYLPSFE